MILRQIEKNNSQWISKTYIYISFNLNINTIDINNLNKKYQSLLSEILIFFLFLLVCCVLWLAFSHLLQWSYRLNQYLHLPSFGVYVLVFKEHWTEISTLFSKKVSFLTKVQFGIIYGKYQLIFPCMRLWFSFQSVIGNKNLLTNTGIKLEREISLPGLHDSNSKQAKNRK